MFLMKAIQDVAMKGNKESVAFVMMNVKGTDLLKIDEMNEREDELEKIKKSMIYWGWKCPLSNK